MFLADVVGTVVSPVQIPLLDGKTLLLLRPLDPEGARPAGRASRSTPSAPARATACCASTRATPRARSSATPRRPPRPWSWGSWTTSSSQAGSSMMRRTARASRGGKRHELERGGDATAPGAVPHRGALLPEDVHRRSGRQPLRAAFGRLGPDHPRGGHEGLPRAAPPGQDRPRRARARRRARPLLGGRHPPRELPRAAGHARRAARAPAARGGAHDRRDRPPGPAHPRDHRDHRRDPDRALRHAGDQRAARVDPRPRALLGHADHEEPRRRVPGREPDGRVQEARHGRAHGAHPLARPHRARRHHTLPAGGRGEAVATRGPLGITTKNTLEGRCGQVAGPPKGASRNLHGPLRKPGLA